MAATAAACNLLLTKQQLSSRSLSGTRCNMSFSASAGRDERQDMLIQYRTVARAAKESDSVKYDLVLNFQYCF